jgi:hypothetical protein
MRAEFRTAAAFIAGVAAMQGELAVIGGFLAVFFKLLLADELLWASLWSFGGPALLSLGFALVRLPLILPEPGGDDGESGA